MRKLLISAGLLGGLTAAGGAWAQDAAVSGQTSGQANVGMSLPGAAPATAAAGASDHDQVVGRIAVGYLGRSTLGTGAAAGGGYAVPGTDAAPVIGIRYWLDEMIGLDAGVGFAIAGGSADTEGPNAEFDLDSYTGFIFHAGVPLALASAGHFTFLVVPEANIGFSGGSAGADISHSGFHLDLGARAGAEIHFGFIDLPQLSLQGSVGLRFLFDRGRTEDESAPGGEDGPPNAFSFSATRLETTVGTNPWNIFFTNVAALYYF